VIIATIERYETCPFARIKSRKNYWAAMAPRRPGVPSERLKFGNVISLTLETPACHAADMQRARLTFADDNGLLPGSTDRAANKQ